MLAFVTPGVGEVPAFMISHILTGVFLIAVGVWAALERSPGSVRKLCSLAVAAEVWLIAAHFLLDSDPT